MYHPKRHTTKILTGRAISEVAEWRVIGSAAPMTGPQRPSRHAGVYFD